MLLCFSDHLHSIEVYFYSCVCVCALANTRHAAWLVCAVSTLDFGNNLLIYGLPLRQKAQQKAKVHYDIGTSAYNPYTALQLPQAPRHPKSPQPNQPHLHAMRRMWPKSIMSQKLRGQIFSGSNALLPVHSPQPPPPPCPCFPCARSA